MVLTQSISNLTDAMGKLSRLLSYPARWRRSKGFGVHSPFAYSFITGVLTQTECAYYAYGEIAAFCPRARKAGFNEIFAGHDMSIAEAHLVFRILCHFNPTQIVEMGHGHEVTNTLFRNAVPRARVLHWVEGRSLDLQPSERKTFVLVNQLVGDELTAAAEVIGSLLADENCVIVVRNLSCFPRQREAWNRIAASDYAGMGFTDGHIGIFVAEKGLPHCVYDLVL